MTDNRETNTPLETIKAAATEVRERVGPYATKAARQTRRYRFPLGLLAGLMMGGYWASRPSVPEINVTPLGYSQLKLQAKAGQIEDATIEGQVITGHFKHTGKAFRTVLEDNALPIADDLDKLGVMVEIKPRREAPVNWQNVWTGLLLLGAFFAGTYGLLRRFQPDWVKSRSRMRALKERSKVRLSDLGGMDHIIKELQDILNFLKDPKKARAMGIKTPKGVLFVGPAGTGKSITARALAGETDVPFFYMSGADFVNRRAGATVVTNTFEEARRHGNCIICIEEIHTLARVLPPGPANSPHDNETALGALLFEMTDPRNDGIIVIGLSSRQDLLDPSIFNPERFYRTLPFSSPDIARTRKQIMLAQTRPAGTPENGKVPLAEGVNLDPFAERTHNFTGAALVNLINEAALRAYAEGRKAVEEQDLDYAWRRVYIGPERRSRLPGDPKELWRLCVHEACHAKVALHKELEEDGDKVLSTSVIPQGEGMGSTIVPSRDRTIWDADYLKGLLAIRYAGREGEKIALGNYSSTARDDIMSATQIIWQMLAHHHMEEKLGALCLDLADPRAHFDPWANPLAAENKGKMEKIAERAAMDTISILTGGAKKSKGSKNASLTEDTTALAQALWQYEILSREEIDLVMTKVPRTEEEFRALLPEKEPVRKLADIPQRRGNLVSAEAA